MEVDTCAEAKYDSTGLLRVHNTWLEPLIGPAGMCVGKKKREAKNRTKTKLNKKKEAKTINSNTETKQKHNKSNDNSNHSDAMTNTHAVFCCVGAWAFIELCVY